MGAVLTAVHTCSHGFVWEGREKDSADWHMLYEAASLAQAIRAGPSPQSLHQSTLSSGPTWLTNACLE